MARWIVLAGITALLVVGYFATQPRAEGPGRRNVYAIAAALQQKSDAALAKINAGWAAVAVNGQIATVSGEAPTENDRQDALDAVRSADWSGGTWIGGITKVLNQTTLAEPVKPYEWRAALGERGRIRLSGHVPGQRPRIAIKAEALRLFPQGVDDQMTIARGQPTGDWTEAAIWAMAQLSRLSDGEATFRDKEITLRGSAPNAGVKADIDAAAMKLAKQRKPYNASSDIRLVTDLGIPTTSLGLADADVAAAAPAATPVHRETAADCQKLIDKMMANNTIEFASASSEVDVRSFPLLNRIADTATRCGTLKFRITGHTDNSGAELANRDLSQARAEAVLVYLSGKGVARDRMVALGAGSGQPIADNATPEGQALNRRIEISVTN